MRSDVRISGCPVYTCQKSTGTSGWSTFIGCSHNGQIHVCQLVAMVIWSSTWLIAAKTCLWGWPWQTRLGHVHVHDNLRRTFLLYWNDERNVVFLKRVGSFLSISYKVTQFYASQLTSTIVRRLRVNPITHNWLRLSWTCPWPSKICLSCEWPIKTVFKQLRIA